MRRRIALFGALVLILGACGGGDADAGDAAGRGGSSSPFGDLLGLPDWEADPAAAQEHYAQHERIRQEAVAACMRDQGFTYVAHVDPRTSVEVVDDEEAAWGTREWAATYGFGITTQSFDHALLPPDLQGYDSSRHADAHEEDPNPNWAHMETLSESERAAYELALWGEWPEPDPSMTDAEVDELYRDHEPGGCENEVSHGPDGVFWEAFSAEIDQMYERMQSDPRLTSFWREAADCLADEGFDHTDVDAFHQGLWEQVDVLQQEVWGSMPADAVDDAVHPTLTDAQLTTLRSLQAEEITFAVAAHDCGRTADAESEIWAELQDEYERDFIATHRDAIDALLAGAE